MTHSFESGQRLDDSNSVKAEGKASAVFSPAWHNQPGFATQELSFSGSGDNPSSLIVRQEFSANLTLGAFFNMAIVNGKPQFTTCFALHNSAIYLGLRDEIDSIVWEPSYKLAFNFRFDFKFQGVDYQMSQGSVVLNLTGASA